MKQTVNYFLAIFILLFGMQIKIQAQNPLTVHSNNPIAFDKISVPLIREAVSTTIKTSEERIQQISSIAPGKQNLANTVMALDELFYEISDLQNKLGIVVATSVDDSCREVADVENNKLSLFFSNQLVLNEGLYKAIKKYSETKDVISLTNPQKKYLSEWITTFEKNGMKLSPDERNALDAINNKIIELGSKFDKNIAESKDSVVFSENDLKGVPLESIAAWKKANGKYVVRVNGPNVIKISQYAEVGNTRKIMSNHYNNRAYPQNIKVLDSLLYYRQVYANKLGFKSYAEYALVDKMASKPAIVWEFENNLIEKLRPKVTEDIALLKSLKHQMHPEEKDSLYTWDIGYYTKQLLDKNYNLNTDEVKEYFEMNNTIKGMFSVYEILFGIQIKEALNQPVWHAKVRSFEIFSNGIKLGSFYLDLYPRQNKYTHFACFPISEYRKANQNEVLPVAALVCNFPEGTATQPSLLDHHDVTTMFHEFGHLVHFLLGHTEIATQNAFAVKGDFTEAPSQFLENWCWEYESLKLFAKHYKTGEVLPETLFKKMKAAQMVGSGIAYTRQVYYGILDFTYEDKYVQVRSKGIQQIAKDLFTINQIPYPEGTNFICSFGHLNGYGANYYGYLWSLVYAKDMFSAFQKNGIMDTATGIKYRTEILEKGATINEMEMMQSFLGRMPNSDAFLKSLGIQ